MSSRFDDWLSVIGQSLVGQRQIISQCHKDTEFAGWRGRRLIEVSILCARS
jgi:hypothetical protein